MSKRGRDRIDRLIAEGKLELVAPSEQVAGRLLDDAEAHLRLATHGVADDPAGALQLGYDAARKASVAILAVQGLRATARGGHVAVIDAVVAQFGDVSKVFGRLHTLRRRRNRTEYPDANSPTVNVNDAHQALATAEEALDAARRLLDGGRLDRFT
jgi:hypothetical protein